MATPLQTIITNKVRPALMELSARFWLDSELRDILIDGARDLWGAILDVYGDHYLTIDETHVSLAANDSQLTGVPADCFRVQVIEPRDISVSGSGHGMVFIPRRFKDDAFTNARTQPAQDVSNGGIVYYQMSGQGAPNAAPKILTAPKLSSALLVRLAYNPTLDLDANTPNQSNPIPGESDHALTAWTIAFARAKEREDRLPDPGWLAAYTSERAHILTRLTPRQEQEPTVVEDFF